MNQGIVFIVSGPSGAGKGSVIREALSQELDIKLAISACTRTPRNGEINGETYHFLSHDDFQEEIREENFLEYCRVHDQMYGTFKREVIPYIRKGQDILLEIDVQGGRKVREALENVISIFVVPPTLNELEKRLIARNTEDREAVQSRLAIAGKEMDVIEEYDYVIVNQDMKTAAEDLRKIINKSKEKTVAFN